MRRVGEIAVRRLGDVPRRDLYLLAAAMAVGVALRLLYVALTSDHALAGDEYEYDVQGRLAADGHWFWSTTPYGIPHPSLWKPPGYPAWVGVLYSVVGEGRYTGVFVIQALIGAVVIGLVWLLARRLFGPRVATGAAFLVAIYPLAWQFEVRLYSEALTTPLVLLALILFLDRGPTVRRAIGLGVVMGLLLLIRPATMYLFPGLLLCWWLLAGGRRAIAHTALAAGVALLVLAPWTARNWVEFGEFIPISVHDTMVMTGTFNDESANDPVWPYGWRPDQVLDPSSLDPRNPVPDNELRARAADDAKAYISDHPYSVPKSFFWNGITRVWDLRRPARAMSEAESQGRSELVAAVGLGMYYVLLPLAALALWRNRRRRALVLPLMAIALGASVVHFAEGKTRYRVPLEPVICVLATSAALTLRSRQQAPGGPLPATATA